MENSKNPQIKLRAMEPEDLEFMYGVENDDRLWNVGVTNVPYSRSMLLDYITSATGDIFADKQVRLMIDNEVGETIGMVDLMDFLLFTAVQSWVWSSGRSIADGGMLLLF